ncbi:MAG: ABC transporter permease [Alphaproteobacteria bacterium]|nr:ABC transporter permease [Alphaproteobacteria bacterium]
MVYWTFKSLFSQPMALFGAAVGIALALILGLFLDAVFRGEASQILTFVERSPGEVWVLEAGVENLHMARSVVPEPAIAATGAVTGVKTFMPLLYRDGLLGPRGEELFAYVAGIPADPDQRTLWQQTTGWTAPEPGGITLPRPMSAGDGYQLGDTIAVSGADYTVTGFSDGTFSMANPLVFIDEADARRQFVLDRGANMVLVLADTGIDPAILAKNIEAEVPGVRALTRTQLMANDYALALDMGGALIAMMGAIGTGVAALIVAFTAYAFVSVRIGELAVAKALGAPQHQLILSAMVQTGLVALLGVALGLGAIVPMQAALSAWVPEVAVQFSFVTALQLGAATFVAAELAALIPAIYVQKVDPALVFNA